MPEEIFNNFIDAIEKLSKKIDNLAKSTQDNSIDSLTKSNKPKLKQLFDYTKSEFKEYFEALLTLGNAAAKKSNNEGGAEKSLAEEGAKRIGGKIVNVKIEDINPRIVKLLRDEIVEALGQKKEGRKFEEGKKPGWLLTLVALLAGVLIGILDFIKDWFRALKSLLKTFNFLPFLRGVAAALNKKFLDAMSRVFSAVSKSKLGQAISRFFSSVLAKIRGSKIFQWLARIFGSDSFLGKMIRRIGDFFRGTGPVGKGLQKMGNALNFAKNIFARIGSVVGKFVAIARGVVSKMFGILSKSPIFKIARVFGRLLGPVIAIFDIVTNMIGSIKQQGLSFKSVLDGLLGGIVSFFTLGLLNFENIKKLTDKISAAFSEGNIIEGVMRIILAVPDLIFQGLGKILSWVAGKIFGEEVKKKVQDFFSGSFTDKIFNALNKIRALLLWPIKKILGFIKEKFNIDIVAWARSLLDKAPEWVKKLVNNFSGPKDRSSEITSTQITAVPATVPQEVSAQKEEENWMEKLFKETEDTNENLEDLKDAKEEELVEYKEPVFEPDIEYTPPEVAIATRMESTETPTRDKLESLYRLLSEQLEVLKQVRANTEETKGNTAISSVSNNTVVHNSPNMIDMFRKSLLAT